MRHKEVHGINVHPSMKFALDFGMSLISEKIRKRVKLYSNLEEVLSSGNLEIDILPKEYGGVMPMAEMIGKNWPILKFIILINIYPVAASHELIHRQDMSVWRRINNLSALILFHYYIFVFPVKNKPTVSILIRASGKNLFSKNFYYSCHAESSNSLAFMNYNLCHTCKSRASAWALLWFLGWLITLMASFNLHHFKFKIM